MTYLQLRDYLNAMNEADLDREVTVRIASTELLHTEVMIVHSVLANDFQYLDVESA